MPAFHGFGFPGLSLAEAGQSTMRKKMLTLVDATFDDVIKQMQQDKIYSMTLQNEVKGLGQQRKTMTEIYQEGEKEQKQCALRYVQTLQHVMKSESHLWNEIKVGTYSKSSVLDPTAFYPNEHAKHKYVSESDDEDKQKPKEKTKGMGKGKGDGKKSTKGVKSGGRKTSRSQDTFAISSSQGLQAQGFKVPSGVHKDKVLKLHHMGCWYPMIMKLKFSRMKFQQLFYTTSLSKYVILHHAGNSGIHGI